jgi:hypothetical protein
VFQLEFGESFCYASTENVIWIPILLRSGQSSVSVRACIDTGSTYCIFESDLAIELRIDLTSGVRSKFRTANSSFEAFGHEVEIVAKGVTTHSTVYFFADPTIKKNVLGRNGWLDRVRFGLVHHESLLYLDTHV